MALNRVIRRSGEVLLDLSTDSVTPETLIQGVTSHNAYGETIQGTFTLDSELTTQDNLISQIQTALQNKAAGSEPTLQTKQVTATTSQQIVKPDSGYDGLSQVIVDGMFTAEQATPSITVSTSGLITASSTQTAGYVASGTKSATKQLTTQAAKTITPSTSSQTAVASGRYTTGAVTIAGDANLKAENIKSGVSIFGVTGTHSGGSGGNIKTCNVTITSSVISKADGLLFTTYDGTDVTASYYPSSSLPVTVENVLCGSGFHLNVSPYLTFPGFNVTNGSIERKHMQLFRLVAESGAEVTINIYDND